MGKGPKRGYFSRSRSLADFNKKFAKDIVQKLIRKALSRNKTVRVLEIGCGEGRVLMELRKLFPVIELRGINRKPWSAMRGTVSLKRTATYYNILTNAELKKVSLPKIYFYDAKKLQFPDNYFDLIISQVAIQYVARKDLLVEEVWRTLKLDGKALLNIDSGVGRRPDFLDFETPRFIMYKKKRLYPVKSLIRALQKKGYDIKYTSSKEMENNEEKKRINVTMTKNTPKKLKLHIQFDTLSSFNLNILNEDKDRKSIFYGYRSVYRL